MNISTLIVLTIHIPIKMIDKGKQYLVSHNDIDMNKYNNNVQIARKHIQTGSLALSN